MRRAAWLPRVGDLFGALKTPAVEFSLEGDAFKIGGWLSAADRQALTDRLRGIFGAQATIGSPGDAAVDAVRATNTKALSALDAIRASGPSRDALLQGMNLAVINFPSGSAEIPADSLEIIRQSVAAITSAPASLKIEISGHTDDTGDPAANLTLSQARAKAVKTALVRSGVLAAALTANGDGDTRPRVTNDTEYGRSRIDGSSTRSCGSPKAVAVQVVNAWACDLSAQGSPCP